MRWAMVLAMLVAVTVGAPLLGQSAAQQPGKMSSQRSQPVTITKSDDGKEVTVPNGGSLLVQLESNPTTGFSWELNSDPSPLVLVDSDFRRGAEGAGFAGAPGTQQLRFDAKGSGTASLQLAYRRPWEKDVAPAKTFRVTVHVK